ncbi:transcription factor RelB isoform X2 [Nelusetta ayraudi]
MVARGTGLQPTRTFPQPPQHPSRDMSHSSRGAAPAAGSSHHGQGFKPALGRSLPQTQGGNPAELERILERPRLVVVEQPKERGMRFRYECEGRSAGSILGSSSTESTKTQPAIEIQGSAEHLTKVTVTVSLVTKDLPHRPHPHCLVGKDCPHGSGICVVTINPLNSRRHSFANLGIQCVRRKELDFSLQKRRSQNIDPFQTGDSKGIEDMDMNTVRLCFQCELEWDDGRKDDLSPVVSNPIYDKKATTTSQLKISCLNQYRGSCAGQTEIYMLCDKVQKDDIEIVFRRDSWKANGEFSQTDVHRQIAIVFKTPPYQHQNITEEVEVSVSLRRLSDQMESEPISFTYLPNNSDPYQVKRKRKFKSDISLGEKPCLAAETVAAAEMPFHCSPPPMAAPSDERLCGAQLASCSSSSSSSSSSSATAAAVSDPSACYGEHLNPASSDAESADAVLNQLFEIPEIWKMLCEPIFVPPVTAGGEPAPDSSATFFNMDTNQSFDMYMQDPSHYNDMQLNVVESQNLLLESQEGLAAVPQVKTEEES